MNGQFRSYCRAVEIYKDLEYERLSGGGGGGDNKVILEDMANKQSDRSFICSTVS